MRRNHFGFLFASTLLVSASCSLVVGSELDSKPEACHEDLCMGVPDGSDCSTSGRPNRICVANCCVVARCGDGYVDADAGEVCDDGNDVTNDGCDPDCTYSCGTNADCDDGNDCNGAEECATNAALKPVCQSVAGNLPAICSACTVRSGGAPTPGQCTSATVCEVAPAECAL